MAGRNPKALPVDNKIFTSLEARTLLLRLYNELSEPDQVIKHTSGPDYVPIGSSVFAGHKPWHYVVFVQPPTEIRQVAERLAMDNRVIAVVYDPDDIVEGAVTGYAVCKNRSDAEAIVNGNGFVKRQAGMRTEGGA